jgi:predicted RNA-binding Zn ribbon-like protein
MVYDGAVSRTKRFLWVGNSACLDFVNTQVVRNGALVDLLGGFDDLVTWLVEAGIVKSRQAKEILDAFQGSAEATKTFARALEFRATLRRMVERMADGKGVPMAAVEQINELLGGQVGRSEMKRVRGGFEKHFRADFREPAHLLWPLAESACDLLVYRDPSLVRKCENGACVLFFYDTSKNHSRRWCSMSACGNRMKVAAYYRRMREEAT